jgi:YesN/AraC family two-component response regulator
MNNYKLLYIEDEDEIRKEYADYFSIFFDTIYEACDGEDGWEKYIRYKPDIIIADISMPKLNGLDLVKKIRKGDKKTQIIMLTAHSDEEKLFTAIGLNLVEYILKPMSRKKIKDTISKAIANIEDENGNMLFLDKDISWDKESSSLYHNGDVIALSKQERRLMELLVRDKNHAIDSISIFNYI